MGVDIYASALLEWLVDSKQPGLIYRKQLKGSSGTIMGPQDFVLYYYSGDLRLIAFDDVD